MLFDYLERFIVCLSPIIIAWFGYRANKNEKQTKKYLEAQKQTEEANKKVKEMEKADMDRHFSNIDSSISSISAQLRTMEDSIHEIKDLKTRIDNVIELSNINFEFCTSLSSVISSIGRSLANVDGIDEDRLNNVIEKNESIETELVKRVHKIIL